MDPVPCVLPARREANNYSVSDTTRPPDGNPRIASHWRARFFHLVQLVEVEKTADKHYRLRSLRTGTGSRPLPMYAGRGIPPLGVRPSPRSRRCRAERTLRPVRSRRHDHRETERSRAHRVTDPRNARTEPLHRRGTVRGCCRRTLSPTSGTRRAGGIADAGYGWREQRWAHHRRCTPLREALALAIGDAAASAADLVDDVKLPGDARKVVARATAARSTRCSPWRGSGEHCHCRARDAQAARPVGPRHRRPPWDLAPARAAACARASVPAPPALRRVTKSQFLTAGLGPTRVCGRVR